MSKKRQGHFCRRCKQYKANEKFSGRGHAAHICKACSKRGKKPPPIKDEPIVFIDDDSIEVNYEDSSQDYIGLHYDGYYDDFIYDFDYDFEDYEATPPKPKKKRKPNKGKLLRTEQKKKAKALLLKMLADGDMSVKEISEAAAKAGIPHEVLRRAKGSLAIRSVDGVWHLPNHKKPIENDKTVAIMKIKEMEKSDFHILEEFIYWAIFVPSNSELPKRSIIYNPDVFIYIENFGQENDCGVVAEVDGKVIGVAWTRIIPAYGHVDNETPELAISVLPEYRNQGVGLKLMEKLFELLTQCGYKQTSLAVQKENPAVSFYLRLGYDIISESSEEYLMVKKLIMAEGNETDENQ